MEKNFITISWEALDKAFNLPKGTRTVSVKVNEADCLVIKVMSDKIAREGSVEDSKNLGNLFREPFDGDGVTETTKGGFSED